MAVRLSGMVSGLDTDALVQELVSAYSTKKDNIVKAQTKLSWKQESWKTMNSSIYNFYSKSLSSMRLSSSYNKKSANVSNSSVAKVTASTSAVNGTQTLQVKNLAASGYLTGGKIAAADGSNITTSTKLSDITGVTGNQTLEITTGGKTTAINITGDTKVADFVNQLKSAGVNASFDTVNQRFFISAKTSGEDADFTLTANSADGNSVLRKLGILTMTDKDIKAYQDFLDEVTVKDVDGNAVLDGSGNKTYDLTAVVNAAYEKAKTTTEAESKLIKEAFQKEVKNVKTLTENNTKLREQISELEAQKANDTLTQEDIEAIDKKIDSLNEKITANEESILESQKMIDETVGNGLYSVSTDAEGNTVYTADEDAINTAAELVAADKNADIMTQLEADYQTKLQTAIEGAAGNIAASDGAIKIAGEDAVIVLNGAEFTNKGNTFEINGLTIQATAETAADEVVSLTVDTDVDGIYNMIKDFLKEYNTLITSMDKAYNADSSKGYEPLTDDEKEAMTESEIEKWETKIKDSLLRKDATLGSLSSTMKTIMLGSYSVNGTNMTLSSFGISTLGYFGAAENEKGCYHIDGDADDSSTSGKTDKLRAAIASDPDSVIEFFSKLSTQLYTKLTDKMASSTLSSAYTVYNDKQMSKEYSQYTTSISNWEDKISDMEERYYKKFAAMESALASLNSQQTSLSNLFGN